MSKMTAKELFATMRALGGAEAVADLGDALSDAGWKADPAAVRACAAAASSGAAQDDVAGAIRRKRLYAALRLRVAPEQQDLFDGHTVVASAAAAGTAAAADEDDLAQDVLAHVVNTGCLPPDEDDDAAAAGWARDPTLPAEFGRLFGGTAPADLAGAALCTAPNVYALQDFASPVSSRPRALPRCRPVLLGRRRRRGAVALLPATLTTTPPKKRPRWRTSAPSPRAARRSSRPRRSRGT